MKELYQYAMPVILTAIFILTVINCHLAWRKEHKRDEKRKNQTE